MKMSDVEGKIWQSEKVLPRHYTRHVLQMARSAAEQWREAV